MILVDDQLPIVSRILGSVTDVLCVDGRSIDRDVLLRTGATALMIRTVTPITPALLDGTGVRFVASASAGIDHIAEELLCPSPQLTVTHAPGCNAQAVAEYIMTWLQYFELPAGSTLGIIGFGHVGTLTARLAAARGLRIVVNDPPLSESGVLFPSSVHVMDLDDLLQCADVVTLHTPLTDSGHYPTAHLLSADRLGLMKDGATIMNAARGGIIDEVALVREVRAGRLRAVLDVFAGEPNLSLDVVQTVRHCTPHVAGYSEPAKINASRMVLKAYRAWSRLEFDIPDAATLLSRSRSKEQDYRSITEHPFRAQWLKSPTADTFAACRRLTPLRSEHLQPPTWEEINVLYG